MKGSLVLRGFKSWVDKLHHPLPLDRRESNRLLAALKSSFRSHLDETHPQLRIAHEKQNVRQDPGSSRSQAVTHSAIFAADQHMCSILTSPLLSKDIKPVESPNLLDVKARLNVPDTDPFQILNEFRNHPGASVAIAALCLSAFNTALSGHTDVQKRHVIVQGAPGNRVILWLKATGIYGTRSMLLDNTVMTLIVPFLLIEKGGEQLWELLKVQTGALLNPVINDVDEMQSHYKWKSTMLLRMVRFQNNRDFSLNGALATFLRAVRQISDGKDPWFCVKAAGQFLRARLAHPRQTARTQVDVDRFKFDEFIHQLSAWNAALQVEQISALLLLYHPTEPEAESAVKYLRKLLKSIPEKEYGDRLSDLTVRVSSLTGDHLQERLTTMHELCVQKGCREDARFVQNIVEALGSPDAMLMPIRREAKSKRSQSDHRPGSGVVSGTLLMSRPVYG